MFRKTFNPGKIHKRNALCLAKMPVFNRHVHQLSGQQHHSYADYEKNCQEFGIGYQGHELTTLSGFLLIVFIIDMIKIKQQDRKMYNTFKICALCLAVTLVLSACGVKPGSVEPPEGKENTGFPHHYPDVTIDPPPYGGPAHSI